MHTHATAAPGHGPGGHVLARRVVTPAKLRKSGPGRLERMRVSQKQSQIAADVQKHLAQGDRH